MAEVDFYRDRRGRCPVQDFLDRLSNEAELSAVFRSIDLLMERGFDLPRLGGKYTRMIDRKARLFELRPGGIRIAYGEHLGKFILVHSWRKTTQKLDTLQADLAVNRLMDWKSRHPFREMR